MASLEVPDEISGSVVFQPYTRRSDGWNHHCNGLNPNDGTIGWAEFVTRVDQTNATAREIVGTELIYLPGEDDDEDDLDDDDLGVDW